MTHSIRAGDETRAPGPLRTTLVVGAATLLAFALLGYHPNAEDGGIYNAAIEARLQPQLFPHDRLFVVAHTRFSLYTPLVALLVRLTHLPLPWLLLLLQVALLAALLAAATYLARVCFPRVPSWTSALAVAVGAGLPVAGTALYAVDPYCTARSLSSPLLLFAVGLALRGRLAACVLVWSIGAAMHPLMALWSALTLVFLLMENASKLRLVRKWPVWLPLLFSSLVIGAGGVWVSRAPAESMLTRTASLTRAYWFPAQWRWYEWLGAVLPPLLLCGMAGFGRPLKSTAQGRSSALGRCARACASATGLAIVVALLFARESEQSFAVARLQPLRALHLIFLVFLALSGPWLWQSAQRSRGPGRRWICVADVALLAVIAGGTFAMQRALYASSPNFEWPGQPARNAWETAFRWCRLHTPEDALFALPPRYIDLVGEDAISFRATALRSALPDGVKDAGVVAVLPKLAPAWGSALHATTQLDTESDAERRLSLLPLHVSWLVLPRDAQTALPCPFLNSAVRVCRLTPQP